MIRDGIDRSYIEIEKLKSDIEELKRVINLLSFYFLNHRHGYDYEVDEQYRDSRTSEPELTYGEINEKDLEI